MAWYDADPLVEESQPQANFWENDAIVEPKQTQAPGSASQVLSGMRSGVINEIGNRAEALTRAAAQGATLNTSDEAMGGLRSLTRDVSRGIEGAVTGDNMLSPISYNDATNAERQQNKQLQESNPISSGIGGLVGGAATGVGAASTKLGSAIGNSVRNGLLPEATSALGKGANLLSKIVSGGLTGATSAAGYAAGGATEGNRIEAAEQSAPSGALIGAAIPAGVATVNAAKNAIVPVVEEAIKPLAQRARDFGIPLSADQIAPTRVRNTLQKVSQELPFSGVDKFQKSQDTAFTKALAKTIGQDSDTLDAATIQNFRKDVGQKFDNVLSGKTVTVTPEDIQAIKDIKGQAKDNIETGLSDVVKRNVNKVVKQLKAGELSGEQLASIRSQMLKTSTRAQGGASQFIGDIVDSIDNIAAKNITPEEAQTLAEARNQWRNFRTLQPLLEKSTDGTINPTQLINRVAASPYIDASKIKVGEDDLVDLARIGKEFLAKKGGSDTFQKAALGTGAVSALGGAFANPLLTLQAGATAGGVLAANRGLQAVNQSQRLIKAALGTKSNLPLITNRIPINVLTEATQ